MHVYLARDAPLGLVLRRGPSDWARLSVWHTDTDTFEHGQWIHARVYERRSDLSADGSLFIAFIRDSDTELRTGQKADTWIAVSRPPYFTALALWWVGGTYCAGGMFPEPQSLWVGWNAAPDQGRLPIWLRQTKDLPLVEASNDWTNMTVFHNRLLRDGWRRVTQGPRETWEHHHEQQATTLMLTELGWDPRTHGGPHLVAYSLRLPDEGLQPMPRVTWADWDNHGRLVAVQDGKLLVLSGPGEDSRTLLDFNCQQPQSVAAPAWALNWPRRG